MVAQVAADEPETAAKIVQPMMLVCSSLPGTRSSHGARPRNMSSESRVRNRISPIQTNSGSAVSVHDDAVPQIVTAMASPAGRDEKSSMPIHATPASASPIHTPLPSSAKSATTSSVVISASMRSPRRYHSWCSATSDFARTRRPVHSSTSSSAIAISRTSVPTAMASCGIHSGVASLPVDTSLNCHDWKASRML